MRMTIRPARLAAVCLALAGAVDAQSEPTLAASFFPSPPPATVSDGFVYALLGDISQVSPVTHPPAAPFEKVLEVIKRADFVLANQEGTAFDYRSMPWIQGSGMFPMDTGSPRDIKNMGVSMVTLANNHGGDYGPAGLIENMRLLQAAGLPYAGVGSNLREARAATLLSTPKGRVTVVAAATGSDDNNPVPADYLEGDAGIIRP